jgi:hypothetical protein
MTVMSDRNAAQAVAVRAWIVLGCVGFAREK